MSENQEIDSDDEKSINFHQMELDERILKAIAILGWLTPTLIQEKAIPFLLEGKDVLLRARTGSGKTAAFAIPVIQKILHSKTDATEQLISAVILAPSKELSAQIKSVLDDLTTKCQRIVRSIDLSASDSDSAQKHMLAERPDIVVSTPGKLLRQLQAGNLTLGDGFGTLVIDEADLIFSFGYEDDLSGILKYLPPIYQAILASATLSEDVTALKSLVLHNPVLLKLEEPELAPASQLGHYRVAAEETDKAAILYALFKLHLIRGKSIIFVNTVDRCYKLKLFLEQFSIKTCILNSQLPVKIRCHTVAQFNQGLYDIIIASDERALEKPAGDKSKRSAGKRTVKDKEPGVSRGIDFRCISNVINFDFPLDVSSYIHRAGRTARGNDNGSVLSFVDLKEKPLMEAVEDHLKLGYLSDGGIIKNYQFKLDEVESFRYRAKDAWRMITRVAIRDARIKEIKTQMFNSERLKSFFASNPRDLHVLKLDRHLGTVKKQQHLSDVPDYIVPPSLRQLAGISTRRMKRPVEQQKGRYGKSKAAFKSKQNNPLLVAEIDYAKKRKR